MNETTKCMEVLDVNHEEKSITVGSTHEAQPSNADMARNFVLERFDELVDGVEIEGNTVTKEAFTKEVMECSDKDIVILAEAIRTREVEKAKKAQKSKIKIIKAETNWKRRMV